MEIIEVDNLKAYTSLFKYVSMGTTAKCYKYENDKIIKVYRNTPRKKELFERRDMLELLEYLGEIKNDSYLGTDQVFTTNGDIVAYTMPYAKGKTLMNMDRSVPISVLLEQLKKLRYDTYKVMELEYRILDMHDRNIIYSKEEGFKVIDLDGGVKYATCGSKNLEMHDLKELKTTIIKAMLKIPYRFEIEFVDDELEAMYHSLDDNINHLIMEMAKYTNEEEPKVSDLAKKKMKIINLKYPEDEE